MTTLSGGDGPLFSLDLLIFIGFLALTLVVGLSAKRQIKTIQDYALGGRNFSTFTLTATIVATWFGGGTITYWPSMYYSKGLPMIMATLSTPLCMLLMGRIMAPRMSAFAGKVSTAAILSEIYGKKIQVIAAISGIVVELGLIAIQFQVITQLLALILGIQNEGLTIIAAAIVIFYSSWGGIRAVTFTDVVQFFTFGTLIPILCLIVWKNLKDPTQVTAVLSNDPKFQLREVVGWNKSFMSAMVLVFYNLTNSVFPDMFQRLSMARSPQQAKKAFTYAALIAFLITSLTSWLAILLLADNPNLEPGEVLPYLVNHYTYAGFKGLMAAGIIALSMSTADSCMNSCVVLFTHDLVGPLGVGKKNTISTARLATVIVGSLALLLALYERDILSLFLLTGNFYLPVVGVPLWLAVFGFKTSRRSVFIAIASGLTTVFVWRTFFTHTGIDSVMPATIISFLVLLSAHYLLGEPGGWQQPDPDSPLGLKRAARREVWHKRLQAIRAFKLYNYLAQLLPPTEGVYTLLGLYAMAATYIGLYTIERADIAAYEGVYTGIYQTVLWATSAFITYPVWPAKSKRLMTFFWPLGMAAILLFTGMLLVILSHFHPLQLFVLLANFLLVALLIRWPAAIVLAVINISLAGLFFEQYTGESLRWEEMGSLQLRFLYSAFIFTGLLLAFFAYQEAFKRLGQRNEALQHREKYQQKSLLQAATEKKAALTAFQHTGAEKLLSIMRRLQDMHVAKEDEEQMKALQKELLPIAFHLQGIGTRSQDYLRLQVAKLTLKAWCNDIKEAVIKKGVTTSLYCKHSTKLQEINCDPVRLTELLVSSIVALSAQAETSEDKPTILFKLEDTHLSYPLPDVKPGYVKQVPAVRLAITIADDLSPVNDSYHPDLNGPSYANTDTTEKLAQFAGSRIIKSHYGYSEVTKDTLIYVVPVDIEEVRPKDMDKAYMDIGAKPIRADDHFKNNEGIDAQAQEAAFLADVAKKSDADLGMVKMALETIKWYHGSSKRHSGEPFYLHPLSVAQIVLGYNTDEATIIGALLHDTVEDTPMQLEHIEAMFGKETAEVVDVVTHLQSIEGSIYKIKMSASENLQMLDRTDSTQGLYVKLADRMHNMRTIGGHKNLAKRQLIAQETADFFIPLAEKLGLKETAAEFEKMCSEVFEQQA